MPGGFGTLDEFFEALTLIQTKVIREFPIIVFCKAFHKELMDYVEKLIVAGTISPVDLDLVLLTDSIEEAVEHIKTNSIDRFGLKYAEPKPTRWLFEKKFF
jgi:predicted Rossmann-fold nucleotide-binding protein